MDEGFFESQKAELHRIIGEAHNAIQHLENARASESTSLYYINKALEHIHQCDTWLNNLVRRLRGQS